MIRHVFNFAASILFPMRCIGCGTKEEVLCKNCITRSRKTLGNTHPYIISLFDFKEPVIRQAIHAIKYYHRRDLIEPLTHALASELKTANPSPASDNWILIPIPMPRARKLMRGYNQAELIAKRLEKELSFPVRTDILTRTRSPIRQVKSSSRSHRMQNQKGSFAALKDLSGMRIILVDDVTTTGATLSEARKVLLARGAANVLALTLAH